MVTGNSTIECCMGIPLCLKGIAMPIENGSLYRRVTKKMILEMLSSSIMILLRSSVSLPVSGCPPRKTRLRLPGKVAER